MKIIDSDLLKTVISTDANYLIAVIGCCSISEILIFQQDNNKSYSCKVIYIIAYPQYIFGCKKNKQLSEMVPKSLWFIQYLHLTRDHVVEVLLVMDDIESYWVTIRRRIYVETELRFDMQNRVNAVFGLSAQV